MVIGGEHPSRLAIPIADYGSLVSRKGLSPSMSPKNYDSRDGPSSPVLSNATLSAMESDDEPLGVRMNGQHHNSDNGERESLAEGRQELKELKEHLAESGLLATYIEGADERRRFKTEMGFSKNMSLDAGRPASHRLP